MNQDPPAPADAPKAEVAARPARRIAAGLVIYGSLLVIGVGLPQTLPSDFDPVHQVVFGPGWLADAIRNVALFVPFGLGLSALGMRTGRVIALGLMASATIEAVQISVPGRFVSGLDVVSNTLGTALGACGPRIASALRRETQSRPGTLAVAASALACVMFGAASWFAQPSIPDVVFYGGWTPSYGGWDRYHGVVEHADIAGIDIPPWGPVARSEDLRKALLAHAPMDVHLRAGPAPVGLAPIVSLVDDQGREYLLLGAHGHDLIYQLRSRGLTWGLHSPMGALEGVLSDVRSGDSVAIRIDRSGSGTVLQIDGEPAGRIALSPARSWAFLLWPRVWPAPVRKVLDALWLAVWIAPAAFWCTRRPSALWALAGLLGLLAVLPWFGAFSGLGSTQWGIVAAVCVASAMASRGAAMQRDQAP